MTGNPMLLQDLLVVPMDGPAGAPLGDIARNSIRIRDGRIAAIGTLRPEPGEPCFDGDGLVALPGFVQGHVHYCQTLFRGLADDLPLLRWLQERIWPLEAAHSAASTRASAWLSVAELLRGGTTTVQVMESVRHAEQAFAVAAESGMTTILGNCLMDVGDRGTPPDLVTSAAAAMRIVDDLHREFHRPQAGLHYAVSPRFVLSCSEALSREAAAFAVEHGLRVHTHACEHAEEVRIVRERFGRDYVLVLAEQGLLHDHTTLAHCVHTTEAERGALVASGAGVLHCPTTNLKLGSGLAPIAEYARRGIRVAIGADGAACNNRLSMLQELRQAALLQSVIAGPGTWPAARALHAATAGGAATLGLDAELGTLTPGKRADLVLLDLGRPPLRPGGDVVSRIVYAAGTDHVRHVVLGGRFCVRDGELTSLDVERITAQAETELAALLSRTRWNR